MSWDDYVSNLMDKNCQDAAIVGICGTPCVWAAHPGGQLRTLSPAEVSSLIADDRSGLLVNGLSLGGMKCSVIRDQFNIPDIMVMDVKTKNPDGPTYNVAIGRAKTALVIVVGAEGVHGGTLHTKAHEMAKYLRDLNF
ncbi:profilin-2-like [Spea bombifrons]|uniref:profilin-2-like n=1 Tax=Spea bombifrons TaxID=233779 RepID=UPI00234B9403|nr:profilin-2-like [Spea bombifrons]